MNHKQKLGYTLLGAGIMALGIIIGQVITPDIEAQSNVVLDEITCRSLKVVDKDGKMAIDLSTSDGGGRHIVVYNKEGRTGINLVVEEVLGNSVAIFEKDGGLGIGLSAWETGNRVSLQKGSGRLELFVDDDEFSQVEAYWAYGEKSSGVSLKSSPLGSSAAVYCAGKGGIGLSARDFGTRITVSDGAGQIQWEAP